MMLGQGPEDVKVTGLFSYPLKGARVVAHESAQVLTTGLLHDRQWMVVDVRQTPARFVSQRDCPRMATLQATTLPDGALRLAAHGHGEIVVLMAPKSALVNVQVWSFETTAVDAGDEAAHWCAEAMGISNDQVRLVRFNDAIRRDCNQEYAGGTGAHTYFADGYPLLVANTTSLADLRARIAGSAAAAITIDRFRPNIVVDGLPAWDEDHVETLQLGAVTLKLVKPCVRCQVTTTDQRSGERASDEPLSTLARFRNNPHFGGVTFGWNAVVLSPGLISLGDVVAAEYRF